MINAGCRRVNIGFIYVGGIDISSFAYIGLFGCTEVDNLQGVPPTGGEGETMVTP